MEGDQILRIRGLSISFKESSTGRYKKVVDRVDMDMAYGESLCLVGESGCGKTVTALSIMGLLPPMAAPLVEGSILFDGRDLLKTDERSFRSIRGKDISMVFQEPMTSLNPVLTVGEQIREVFFAHMGSVALSKEVIEKECIDLLRQVGMPYPQEQLKAYPHMLSGGQRQRIMIAMAVALRPKLIIADEPTTALDVTVQLQILKLLKGLQKKGNSSLLFITHDLSLVPYVGDRVCVMYGGQIMECGPSRDITNNPLHPYTRALLGAVLDPDLGPDLFGASPPWERGSEKWTYNGGCIYYGRCPLRRLICMEKEPPLKDMGGARKKRCHLNDS